VPPVELPDPAPLFASSVLCASLGSLCLGYRVGAWHQDVSAAPYRRVLIGLVTLLVAGLIGLVWHATAEDAGRGGARSQVSGVRGGRLELLTPDT
jgi:hypothetical protein